MKVTTDGCLFGAIAAGEISSCKHCRVLDIGTGTGLLSLMIAQQNPTTFTDAIEIDEAAAQQAKENAMTSPWAGRIHIFQGDILNYPSPKWYDVIVSNPPFYEKQLTSPATGRQMAHHSSGLTLQQLFQQVKKLLHPQGKFYVLIPFYRTEETISLAKTFDLFPEKHWFVKQTPTHNWFRSVLCFTANQQTCFFNEAEVCIKNNLTEYSAAFISLLQPFYLKW